MSWWDFLFNDNGDNPWSNNGGNIWSGVGGVPGLADKMGTNLTDLIRNSPEMMDMLASGTPDETIIQPTIENWRNPNKYATENPLWMLADIAGAAGAAKGLYSAGKSGLGRLLEREAAPAPRNIYEPTGDYPFGYEGPDPGLRTMDAERAAARRARRNFEATPDPDTLEVMPPESETGSSTLSRLLREERGGNLPEPTSRPEKWWADEVRSYQKNRQPDLRGSIEDRTPNDLSPEARNIRDMLESSGWSEETRQAPTMGPRAAADLERAIAERQRAKALMEGVDNTGHTTKMNAQGGAGVTQIRQGRRIGGESQQWAPFDREVEAPGSRPRPSGRPGRLRNDLNPDVNNIPDTRPGPHEGVFEYEAGVGIRDLLDSPQRTIQDLFEHETDLRNLDSIRRTGVEARWDPAEEGRKLVSARRHRPGAEEPPENRARIIFRTDQTPMEQAGLNTVKFREGIRPEDIVDIIQRKKSTLGNLAEDVKGMGRELDPDFETKPKPSPSPPRKLKTPRRVPPTPMPKNTSGPTPSEMAARARHQQL